MFAEAELIFILTESGSSATRAGFWVGSIKGEKATDREGLTIVIS